MALLHGATRRLSALYRGRNDVEGLCPEADRWDLDIESAMAEMAVAKAFNLYWRGVSGVAAIDVGEYQVRSTYHQDGCLRLTDHDRDEEKFVLVVTDCPNFRIVGWIKAGDGKKPKYFLKKRPDRPPVYWVPQKDLLPLETLENVNG